MIVLARVNGYYSPYFPQTIMEGEARCIYGTNFSHAEKDFYTNKLLKMSPNTSKEAAKLSIDFLGRLKEANCPCTIHTQKRGYDWIVFNRMPDRISSNNDDMETHMSDSDEDAEDEDSEVVDTTTGSQNPEEMEEENDNTNQDVTDASGASSENTLLLILLLDIVPYLIPKCLILCMNFPSTPGMTTTSQAKGMIPSRPKTRRKPRNPPKCQIPNQMMPMQK